METSLYTELKSSKIYVIDDSKAFGMGIASLISGTGANVEIFLSAQAALVAMSQSKPDMIITDLEMPEMNGFELITHIRTKLGFNELPILVLTGDESSEVMVRAIVTGADAFVTKKSVRETILAQVLALARLNRAYKAATQGKQLEAVKALIGTYKHEFGNALAIIDGKFRKLIRENPQLLQAPASDSVKKGVERMVEILKKLDELQRYEEQSYHESTHILKAG